MAFNPDEYLKGKEAGGFDPDAYLRDKEQGKAGAVDAAVAPLVGPLKALTDLSVRTEQDPEALARGAAQGATLGWADEGAGAAGAVRRYLLEKEGGKPIGDLYREERDDSRAKTAAARDRSPDVYGLGEAVGNVPLLAVPAATGASKMRALASLAGIGGAQGLGSSSGPAEQQAADAVQGAVVGAALGAVAPAAARGADKAADTAVNLGRRALGYSKRLINKQGLSRANEVARTMLDQKAIPWNGDADDILTNVQRIKGEAGSGIGELRKKMDENGLGYIDTNELIKSVEKLKPQITKTGMTQQEIIDLAKQRAAQDMADHGVQIESDIIGRIKGAGGIKLTPAYKDLGDLKYIPKWLRPHIFKKNGAPLDEVAESLGMSDKELISELEKISSAGRVKRVKPLGDHIQDIVDEINEAKAGGIIADPEKVVATGGLYDKYGEAADEIIRTLKAHGDSLPMGEAEQLKTMLYRRGAKATDPIMEDINKGASRVLRESAEKQTDEFAKITGGADNEKYLRDKRMYGIASDAEKAALDKVNREAGNSDPSLRGTIIGGSRLAAGDPVGAASSVFGFGEVVRKGAGFGANAADAVASMLRATPDVFGQFAPILTNALAKGQQSFAVTNYLLSQQSPEYQDIVNKIQKGASEKWENPASLKSGSSTSLPLFRE
jgi:hypothetical protein